MLKYLASIYLLGLSFVLSAQDRNVLWLHGLGEDGTTWNTYEAIFDAARQVNGESPGYNSFNGLTNAANVNINRFATGNTNTNNIRI